MASWQPPMCAVGPGSLLLEEASHLGYPSLLLPPDPTTLRPSSQLHLQETPLLSPSSLLLGSRPLWPQTLGPDFTRRRTGEHPGQGKHSALRLDHMGAEHRVWPCQKYLDVPKLVGLLQGCLGEGRLSNQSLGWPRGLSDITSETASRPAHYEDGAPLPSHLGDTGDSSLCKPGHLLGC